MSLNDNRNAFYKEKLNTVSEALNSLEKKYWNYLNASTGSLQDAKKEALRSIGFTGSVDDMEEAHWKALSNPNLVTNGDFSNGTTGTTAKYGAILTTSNGVLRVTNDNTGTNFGQANMTGTTVVGKRYMAGVSRVGGTGTGRWHIGVTGATSEYGFNLLTPYVTFIATDIIAHIQLTVGGSTASAYFEWDNVFIKEV